MSTRANKVSGPQAPKTRRGKVSPEETQAALTQAGQAAVAKEIKKLEKTRERNAKSRANAKDPNFKPMTKAEALAKARAAQQANGTAPTADSQPKQTITAHKLRLMATTGMTPLEFLTAVYRDQLYADYDVEIVDANKGLAQFFPKLDPVTGELATTKVELKIEQRIAAATSAAPYVHRKKPIGIDGGEGKPLTVVTADRLAQLSNAELDNLLQVFGKLGVGAEFEGGAQRPYGIDAEDNS